MKQKHYFLSFLITFAFFGYVHFSGAQASNFDIPVGVLYNADGTCDVILPGGTTNGVTVTDVNGEQTCVVEPENTSGEVPAPIIEVIDEVFDQEFGGEETPPGDRIIVPPPTSPTPYVLFYVNEGGTLATIPLGGSATVFWQAENIVENTCRGTSLTPVPGWPSTLRQPFMPMVPEVPMTFSRPLSALTEGTHVLTLTGCRGWDGSFVPDQSVTIVVADEPTPPDTGTTSDGDTTDTIETTPSINRGIRWNEQ